MTQSQNDAVDKDQTIEKIEEAINKLRDLDKSASSMLSDWCISILGELSQKFLNKMLAVSPTMPSTLQELKTFWTKCSVSKSLVTILCKCLPDLDRDAKCQCLDSMLVKSTKFSPYFNWVLEYTESYFQDAFMEKMLSIRLESYAQNANAATQTSKPNVEVPTTNADMKSTKDVEKALRGYEILKSKVDKLKSRLKSSQTEKKELLSKSESQQTLIKNLEKSNSHNEQILESYENELTKLKMSNEELEEKVQQMKIDISKLIEENNDLRKNSVQRTSSVADEAYADILRKGCEDAKALADVVNRISSFKNTQSSIFLKGYLGTRLVMVRKFKKDHIDRFKQELLALNLLKGHKHIAPDCLNMDLSVEDQYFIVFDLYETSLDDLKFKTLEKEDKINFTKQLLEMLILLEEYGIVHNYILPRHILINKDGRGYRQLFLTSFEKSTIIQNQATNLGSDRGNPEAQMNTLTENQPSHLSDVFEMGHVIFLIWTGKNYEKLITSEKNLEMSKLPEEVRHLLSTMLASKRKRKPASILKRFPVFWDIDVAKRFVVSSSKLIERNAVVCWILSQVEHKFKQKCTNIGQGMKHFEGCQETQKGFVKWYRNVVEHFEEIKDKAKLEETPHDILKKTSPKLCPMFDSMLPHFDKMFINDVWPELSKKPLITIENK